jgi:hypothetical protein
MELRQPDSDRMLSLPPGSQDLCFTLECLIHEQLELKKGARLLCSRVAQPGIESEEPIEG